MAKVSKAWGEVKGSFGELKNEILGVGTAIVGTATIVGGAFAFIAKSSIHGADEMLSMSKQTGVTVEGLQKLRFIAEQTGSSTEDLDTGLKKFTVNMGMARAGQGALFSILSKVNPEILRQMMATKDNEQAFTMMLGVIRKLPKAQQQAALAQVAFGRGNLSLIATAKAGSAEYERLKARLEAIGIVTKEQAEQANETADAWSELWTALQRARDAVIFQTMPALKELAKTLTQFLIDNKGAIQEWGKEFAARLPAILNGLVTAVKAVIAVLTPLVSLIQFVAEHTVVLNLALAFLAEIFAFKLGFAIYNVVKALGALNLVILGTPIGWIILAITALVAALALLYTYWDNVVGIWREAVKVVEGYISAIAEAISWTKKLPTSIMTKLGFSSEAANVTGANGAPRNAANNKSEIKVSFDNLPKGSRVTSDVTAQDVLDLSMGYAMQ